MLQLNEKAFKRLLKAIKNPKDRKRVEKVLQEIMELQLETERAGQLNAKKRQLAKSALNTLWSIVVGLGKHELYSEFFKLFD